MLSLFEGYLLIFVALFAVNISLFLGNFKINNLKAIIVSIVLGIILIGVNAISSYFKDIFVFLSGYLFILIAIVLFILTYLYLKKKDVTLASVVLFYIAILSISAHIDGFSIFNSLLLALFLVVIIFVVYQLSKLLFYAKREYSLIVGEFMILESILIFILGLTYWSVKDLDYSMFSPYLILTPTYQVVYVVILIIFILIVGLYYNDKQLKKR